MAGLHLGAWKRHRHLIAYLVALTIEMIVAAIFSVRFSGLLFRSLMVSPLLKTPLTFFTFSKQTAIRLIASSHTYNAARHIHLSKLMSLFASSDLSAITLVEQSVKAPFFV